MSSTEKQFPVIETQAAIAVMLVQFIHKIVREIPGAIKLVEGPGVALVVIFAAILFVGILLLMFKIKLGLILGFLDGFFLFFSPIVKNIILGIPDQNGVWWYPLFPWTQSILIIYFCRLAWKKWQ